MTNTTPDHDHHRCSHTDNEWNLKRQLLGTSNLCRGSSLTRFISDSINIIAILKKQGRSNDGIGRNDQTPKRSNAIMGTIMLTDKYIGIGIVENRKPTQDFQTPVNTTFCCLSAAAMAPQFDPLFGGSVDLEENGNK